MRVRFQCGYYSDLASNARKRRTEDYWDAYFYFWAVKVGSFKKCFYIHDGGNKTLITAKNFGLVRRTFGAFICRALEAEGVDDGALLVPIPSKDGIVGKAEYRASIMLAESLDGTCHAAAQRNGLLWSKKLPRAHEGGLRLRAYLKKMLVVDASLKGKSVVLVDDLLTTGGSMLAAQECLQETGAKVVCGVTCGKTIYDFNTPNFGNEVFDLRQELDDFA